MKHFLLLVTLLILTRPVTFAQKKNEDYKLHIKKASSPIVIDGAMDEQAWLDADVATDFFSILP
ncbi:MAG: hypothetical protein RIB86_05980, partial [Imperialibacter sp.]